MRNQGFGIGKSQMRFSLEKLLIVTICIGIALRFINLGSREFWYDEILSLLLATGQKIAYSTPDDLPVVLADYTPLLSLPPEASASDILTTVRNLLVGLAAEPHPPLFFLAQHLWLRLFGNSETAVRSLGALLSSVAIFGAYGLGRKVLGHRGGLLLAAALSVNPFFCFQSLSVRMYCPLVLWVILSAWAMLELTGQPPAQTGSSHRGGILWSALLVGSVTAGLMTFYQFANFVVTLAALALFLDRRRFWAHSLRLGAGVLLTVPWMLWGLTQQLRNADLNRFKATQDVWTAGFLHLQDIGEVLGINLLVGDWETSLPLFGVRAAGLVIAPLLLALIFLLWRLPERRALGIALFLGFFPLLLALAADIAAQKYTLSEGGRSITILPGCLLLLCLGLERTAGRWRTPAILGLLLLYLSLSAGDFSLRNRQMFHTVNAWIEQDPATPTLIAMNSRAWGYVLRLAYYITPSAPVTLLAQDSAGLAPALKKVLSAENGRYPRILWLDMASPIWSPPSTPEEKQQIQQVLTPQFQLAQSQQLSGPKADLDKFTANLYKRSPTTGNTKNEYEPA
jgi:uncharacterized membrane protein